MQNREESQQTGTKNETYNVISIMYHALQGAENCQTYLNDAQDGQAREFFQQALQAQRQLADRGKEVLQQVLQKDTADRARSAGARARASPARAAKASPARAARTLKARAPASRPAAATSNRQRVPRPTRRGTVIRDAVPRGSSNLASPVPLSPCKRGRR